MNHYYDSMMTTNYLSTCQCQPIILLLRAALLLRPYYMMQTQNQDCTDVMKVKIGTVKS